MSHAIAVLDIASDSVGSGYFLPSEKAETPDFFSLPRRVLPKRDAAGLQNLLDRLMVEVKAAAGALAAALPGRAAKIYCLLGSPFYWSQVKRLRLKREKDFFITDAWVKGVVTKESEKVGQAGPDLFPDLASDQNESLLADIMRVEVNGYQVLPNPKLRGHEVTLDVHFCQSSDQLLGYFREAIKPSFRHTPLILQPFSQPLYRLIVNSSWAGKDWSGLVINLENEATEVLVLERGNLAEIFSFPGGSHLLLERYEERFKAPIGEAADTFARYLARELTPAKQEAVEKLVKEAVGEWQAKFLQAMEQSDDNYLLGRQVWLMGQAPTDQIYGQALSQTSNANLIVSNQPFDVGFLSAKIGGTGVGERDNRLELFAQVLRRL